jgi:zinc-dependent metalloproteinase lipoprotein
MKSTLRYNYFNCFLLLFLCFFACENEAEQTLDRYYPVRNVKLLEMDQLEKTDYFVGTEDIAIRLNVKAFDGGGTLVKIPEDLVLFTANGKEIEGNQLDIEVEGTYSIVAHIGKLHSDTLTIRALDPSKLSLHLAVDDTQKEAFKADGKAKLDFKVELFHHGVAIPLSSEFAFYCNNEPLAGESFTTRKAGQYKFKATGANLTSNEITVEALSPVRQLRISKQSPDTHFFGYNISETAFLIEGFDKEGQPVELSEDIELFRENVRIDKNIKFRSNKLGLATFQARGYKIQSNALPLEVKSPVKSIKLEYKQYGNTFWADGVSEIGFTLNAFDFDGKPIAPTADVKLYEGANVIDYAKKFTTRKSGELIFKAKGFNSESNGVTITATAPNVFNIVRIPVIFHEVNTTKLTQAKINELLEGVTKAFRNQWNATGGPKDANSCDLFIEVYAADRDPKGNLLPIKGLDRVKSVKQSFYVDSGAEVNEAAEDAFGNYLWDQEHYFNIWVYPNIEGDYANASWAYYPTVVQALEGVYFASKGHELDYPYGAFLNARHLEGGDGVEVTAHEIGHALALAHVFDGGLNSHFGCSKGDPDYCGDTKFYDRNAYEKNYQATGYNRETCEGEAYIATNIMDYYYSHDNSFTIDQRKRVRHTIDYGLSLPTQFNGFQNGRMMREKSIKKPQKYVYRAPIACHLPVKCETDQH